MKGNLRVFLAAALCLFGFVYGGGRTTSAQEGEAKLLPQAVAEIIRQGLFSAQTDLIAGNVSEAAAKVLKARKDYEQWLAPRIAEADPGLETSIAALFEQAETAAQAGSSVNFAAVRGQLWTELLGGSASVVFDALQKGEVSTAQQWFLLREFRTATKFTRPGADGALALNNLEKGSTSAADVLEIVRADLQGTYQTKLNEAFADAKLAHARGFGIKRAEAAGMAAGYFRTLQGVFAAQMGEVKGAAASATFKALLEASATSESFEEALIAAQMAIRGFQAVPLSTEALARYVGQFNRFLALVPVEYGRGVRDGQVTNDIEVQEAITFRNSAQTAFDAFYVALMERDAAKADALMGLLSQIDSGIRTTIDPSELETLVNHTSESFLALVPQEWVTLSAGSDFDVIDTVLDQLAVALRAGQYDKAESARVEAYAILDSGIEQKLRGFQPELGNTIEVLFWHGTPDQPGLATLLGNHAPLAEVTKALGVLRAKLKEAETYLASKSAPAAVIGNSAVIVFREGLEAVLILASLLASLRGAETRKFRTPIVGGAALAFIATAITWVIANSLLMSLIRYGEKLEAIVSLIAIGVLLLILNWFFHKVYWTGWIAGFHARKGQIIAGGLALGQIVSLVTLGFSSIYREGFETVLFLQSLVLDAGLAVVLEGVVLGLIGVSIVGLITFAFQVRLPYKKMLIVTGVMIGAVLLIMVGNTVHVFQAVGWLPITPIAGVYFPHWMGQWLGLYATWQGIGLQLAAAAYVIGTYFWAERMNGRKRKQPRHPAKVDQMQMSSGEG